MLNEDGAIKISPTLKKLDELIEEKKIYIEAYHTRISNHFSSNSTKAALANFVEEIIVNSGEHFPGFNHDSIFGLAKVFLQENFPTIPKDVIEYGKESV